MAPQAEAHAHDVRQHGLDFALGEVELAGQRAHQGQGLGTQLSAGHAHRQGGMVFATTGGAHATQPHVVGDDGLDLRQLEHLVAHGAALTCIGLDGSTATTVRGHFAHDHLVHLVLGQHGTVAAFVSWLSSGFLAASGALAWCGRGAGAVAGGGLGGVAGVELEPFFQLAQPLVLLQHRIPELAYEFMAGVHALR